MNTEMNMASGTQYQIPVFTNPQHLAGASEMSIVSCCYVY
jgi:hypothetical protein